MMRTPLPVLEAVLDTLLVRSSRNYEKNSFTPYYIILNITITHRESSCDYLSLLFDSESNKDKDR